MRPTPSTTVHRFRADPTLAGRRLAAAVALRVPGLSGRAAKALVDQGRVFVDGRRAALASLRLRGGEEIEVHADRPAARPRLGPEHIVYEGRGFLAIDKPPGMPVYGTRGETAGTVVPELEKCLRQTGSWRPGDRLLLVHRLDRDTSGVLLVARTEEAARDLESQFRQRKVEKRYLALVEGNPKFDRFRQAAPVTPKKPAGRRGLPEPAQVRTVSREPFRPSGGAFGSARSAETEFSVLRRFEDYALVEARPLTGRTHQIRIHLAQLGHPVLGDPLYGKRAAASALLRSVPRQMLHASSLRFRDPDTGQEVMLETPMPEDMREWVLPESSRKG